MSINSNPDGPTGGLSLRDTWLRVGFGAGRGTADFHYRWLRHNCDRERHPLTGERTLCSSELPDDIQPRAARVEGEVLRVTWEPDGHESAYPLAWLDAHAYARDRRDHPPPTDLLAVTVPAPEGLTDAAVGALVARVGSHGLGLLRRAPSRVERPEEETEALIERICARGLHLVGTHFGRIEDLRTDNTTNQNTDQLGYTDAGVELHTDQPFLDAPPRYQLLQGVRSADAGGENFVVDALAASRHLREVDRPAWELLTRVPVRFHRKQRAFERVVDAPVLRDDGRGFMVRYSYFTTAPFARPFDEMEAWYRAWDRFARLVRDPAHQYRFTLAPGDALLYDNHRVLHARTAFRGPRWVRGVYFDPA
ncbi:MAG: TauD/TfdA family dioxygenase [Polyangiales bacterium]